MSIHKFVELAIQLYSEGSHDLALAQVCIAIDGTAKQTFPNISTSSSRFKKLLSETRHIIIPTMTLGHLHVRGNLIIDGQKLENIIYTLIRCALLHEGFLSTKINLTNEIKIGIKNQRIIIPHYIIPALILAVLSQKSITPFPSTSYLHFYESKTTISDIAGDYQKCLDFALNAFSPARPF